MARAHRFNAIARVIRTVRWAVALLSTLWLCALKVVASGAEFSLLHDFPTNSYPQSTLVFGEDKVLYGTTQMGGDLHYGSVFRITADGAFTNLFSFGRTNGAYPFSGLVKGPNGYFYGTAQNHGPAGFGTIFRISTEGSLETLFSFAETNGAYPKGRLLFGKDGQLYGTTYGGGAAGLGTIFRITTNGDFTLLSSFGGTNGAYPFGGVVQAQDGVFYGATRHGGIFDGSTGYGTIYRVSAAGQLTTLHYFDGYGGAYPFSELTQLDDGWLSGATYGTVFRVSTNGMYQPVVINPLYRLLPRSSLMRGNDGALYGLASDHLFRITTNGVVMSLWPFYNFWNGADPRAGLVQANDTSFYGTTAQGGQYGGGVVFRIQLNTFFYPLTRTTNGWDLIFAALAENSYRVLRSTNGSGPWQPVANVVTDEYGVGRWTDTSNQGRAFYRLSFP